MSFPGKTKPERMSYELSYWEQGGVEEHDLHLATYARAFPLDKINYPQEEIMDVGSGAISIFEAIAPAAAVVYPFDILAEEYNRLAPEKKFMIHDQVAEDRQFTLITVLNMIDHVDDPEDLLRFLQKHLGEDGRMWLAVHLFRPHGLTGHPQRFSCSNIVSLLSKFFSIESFSIIREGVPLPYMWCGVLCAKGKGGWLPTMVVLGNYIKFYRMQCTRIVVKGLKMIGMKGILPDAWKF